ncbi:MAG: hypothetical protein DBX59_12145 [Bacillota bacterium]|nr:MAG: hypothetical protein DBX59_12145 [Bacillota bacterium]
MNKFIIVTDSCSDLDRELRETYNIEYMQMHYSYDDKDFPANLDWDEKAFREFYGLMRDGVRIKTTQVVSDDYEKAFESYLRQGYGVLSISCSSALSGSYRGSLVAKDNLKKKYPDAEIVCVDSRNACLGLGLICITAAKLRAEGKTLAETAAYIEAHKQEVNQFGAVDNLVYLKRAGRVSATSAVFGGLLQVKPIIISDVNGQNVAVEKVKGRRNSMARIAELFCQTYRPHPYQQVFVVHGDCMEDAEELKRLVGEGLADKNVDVRICGIGPIIGATTGPGMLGVYGYGKEVTYDGEKQK